MNDNPNIQDEDSIRRKRSRDNVVYTEDKVEEPQTKPLGNDIIGREIQGEPIEPVYLK